MVDTILDKLKVFNDKNFKFDPYKHKYTYNGEHFISVTQFISQFHEKFDTEYWSKYKADESGKPQAEILAEWKQLNDRANEIGTATHNWIENYFNKVWQELPVDIDIIDRINKFNKIYSTQLYKLTPIKFEQRVFSKKWRIAGMFDGIFEYNGNLYILDWKSNSKWTHDDHKDGRFEKLLYPFNDHYKNHLNEYSIQVSLYRLILREYNIDVKSSYLVHIPSYEDAKIYKTKDFTDTLEKYLNETLIS